MDCGVLNITKMKLLENQKENYQEIMLSLVLEKGGDKIGEKRTKRF